MGLRDLTRIKVLSVLAALGLLATPVVWLEIRDESDERRWIAHAKCSEYYEAVSMYRRFHAVHRMPESLEELLEPLTPGQEPILRKLDLDPWGSPYRLVVAARSHRVWSDGPDRKLGTEDDICCPPLEE